MCKILDIKIPKDALQKQVDNTHKMELKTLIQDTQKGLVYPSELECLNELGSLGSFDLDNLGYHDGRAVVLSEPGLHQLLNGTRLHKHRKSIESAVQRWIWATKYETGAGLVDLFTFIRGVYKSLMFDEFALIIKKAKSPKFDTITLRDPLAIEYPCVQSELESLPINMNVDLNVTYKASDGDYTETITQDDYENIRDELEHIIEAIEAQTKREANEIVVINRNELVAKLAQVVPMDKKELWSAIKGITNWKNGKTEIDEFGTTIKIKY